MRENLPLLQPSVDYSADAVARTYGDLKSRLIRLRSAPVLDMPAIDTVIDQLAQTQLAFKAAHGLVGNNPIGD